ncbi:ABC transporter substrate-binding protein [Homoserinimonas sp. OAct 916]|uniref:peptide ABC transporter substrate-binding protein n=1 Tax=Homoserinimonas sp. OAct 916 TaxID=2211450 RepID=UPI000DBE48CA|nr:ABC transporter substrate-binding protein [Homoserinimonas sp. OAct 916]
MQQSHLSPGVRTRTKRVFAVGGLVASLALLSGCATAGNTDASGKPDDAVKTSFTVAATDPVNLTPGNTWSSYIESLLFTAPMALDSESGEPVPAAAASVTSDDQQTWTITLNEGWTFHNGEPVTAQSFVDGWNATALGSNAWLQNYNFANIEGYDAMNPAEGEPTATELSGLTVVSDTEFTVKLTEPYGLFPYAITSFAFAPLPTVAFDDPKAYDLAPVGNGPYSIANSYEPNEPIELTKYADYKGQLGVADDISFIMYQSQDTAYNDMLAGNVDVVYPVPADRLGDVEKRADGRIAVSKIPNLNYLGYPTWDDRFTDVRIREAFSKAIDREALTSSILKGAGAPATAIAPDTTYGAKEGSCEACTFDPAGAKKLLDEAGGWSGPLVLWADQYAGNDQILQAVGNQLRNNLGITEVTFEIQPWAQYSEAIDQKKVDGPFLSYWGAYFPHVAGFLQPIVGVGGAVNYTGYSNDEVEKLVAQADALPIEEGVEYYQQAEKLVWQDMPVMPLYYGQYTAAWTDHLESVPVGVAGLGDLGTVKVAE